MLDEEGWGDRAEGDREGSEARGRAPVAGGPGAELVEVRMGLRTWGRKSEVEAPTHDESMGGHQRC